MSTGDLKNNLRKLQKALRDVRYKENVDFESLSLGVAADYLPILHHALVYYSQPLASSLAASNIVVAGKTDSRFVDAMYKILREVLDMKAALNKSQFLSLGFGEKKIIMVTEILDKIRAWHSKHNSLLLGLGKNVGAAPKPSKKPAAVPISGVNDGQFVKQKPTGRASMPSMVYKSKSAGNQACKEPESEPVFKKPAQPVSALSNRRPASANNCQPKPKATSSGDNQRIQQMKQHMAAIEETNRVLNSRVAVLEAKVSELEEELTIRRVSGDATAMENIKARLTLLELGAFESNKPQNCAVPNPLMVDDKQVNTEVMKGMLVSASGDMTEGLDTVLSLPNDALSPIVPVVPNLSNNNIRLIANNDVALESPPIVIPEQSTSGLFNGGLASLTSTPNDPSSLRFQNKEEQELRILDMMTTTEQLLNMNLHVKP